MDIKSEEGRHSIWDSFQTKVEDMFVTGYNLPEALQVMAVTNVEEKLVLWKGKLALENGLAFPTQPVEVEGGDKILTQPEPSPITKGKKKEKSISPVKANDSQISLAEDDSDADAANVDEGLIDGIPDKTADLDADEIGTSPSKVDNALEYTWEGVEQDPDYQPGKPDTGTPTPRRGRGRPRKNSIKVKVDNKTQGALKMKLKVEKDSGDEAENDEFSTPTKRKRGRPPGSKNSAKKSKPSTPETEVPVVKPESTPDENSVSPSDPVIPTVGLDTPRRGRGRPRGSTGKHRRPKPPKGVKGEKNFSCNVCNKSYRSFDNLQRHMVIHSEGPIKCPQCPKTFMSQSGFEVHLRLHTGVGLHRCTFCSYVTGSGGMMSSHIRRVHEKLRKHLCETCGRGFVTSYMLKRHIESIHMRDVFKDSYKCDFCPYKTHAEACLKSHIKNRHTTMPGFMCNLCGVTLKYKHSLQEHQQRHYSEKKSQCPECPFKAICDADIRKHIRRHHREGGKTYKCEVCSKSFKQKVHLLRHGSIHTGAKDHCCTHCTYQCNDRSNLSKHMWHVHKVKDRTKPVLMKFDKFEDIEASQVEEVTVPADILHVQVHEVETGTDGTVVIEEQTEIVQPIIMPVEQYTGVVQNIEYWS